MLNKKSFQTLFAFAFLVGGLPLHAFDWNASYETEEEAQAAFRKSFKFKKGDRIKFLKSVVLAEKIR